MGLFDGFKKRKKDYKEVAADNIKLSERDMLINKIGSDKIQYICDMYMIKKDELVNFISLVKDIPSEKITEGGELIKYILSNKNMAYLHQFPNVIMTQHMAFYTNTAVKNMVKSGLKGIIEMANQ